MDKVPLISGSADLLSAVERALMQCRFAPPEIPLLGDAGSATDYLNIELPELVLLHFADSGADGLSLLDTIMGDPWLIHGGIVALCDDEEVADRLDEIPGANLIVILALDNLERNLPRLFDIIHDNRRILFQREIGSCLVQEISAQHRLNNDPLEARCFTNLVCNFLFNSNRIDSDTKCELNVAIYEMLANAIEHGNCGISYEEKTDWVERHGSLAQLIRRRCENRGIASRGVTFEYTITPSASRFVVADEGEGFDWRSLKDATDAENLLKPHGRGIMMTRAATRKLSYNEVGNEVRFEVAHQVDEASATPAPLRGLGRKDVGAGELIFREGEPGNSLYYIAKGRFDVIVGERTVSTLTPEDIFLGEMSFLLKDHRSATVRAATDGRLIEISKKDFVEGVKAFPHYALLLSRLLAQRIERANALYRSPIEQETPTPAR